MQEPSFKMMLQSVLEQFNLNGGIGKSVTIKLRCHLLYPPKAMRSTDEARANLGLDNPPVISPHRGDQVRFRDNTVARKKGLSDPGTSVGITFVVGTASCRNRVSDPQCLKRSAFGEACDLPRAHTIPNSTVRQPHSNIGISFGFSVRTQRWTKFDAAVTNGIATKATITRGLQFGKIHGFGLS